MATIGFLPNGVPLKPTLPDNATDEELQTWWQERLELTSAESREAYDRYKRGRD
jgi:hypothetical protein